MTIYTSYFYMVRFFPKNLIPLSTAAWDPKWFHDNKSQTYQFKDKRGVINGIRAEVFAPGQELAGYCGPLCTMEPDNCAFLSGYYAQLQRLNFKNILERFSLLSEQIKGQEHLNSIDFALIFHEAPTKKCSERGVVQRWFAENNYPIHEWLRP